MFTYEKIVKKFYELSDNIISGLFDTILIVIAAVIIYILGHKLITKLFSVKLRTKFNRDESIKYIRRKETLTKITLSIWRYVVYFLAILVLLSAWGVNIQAIATGAGVIGVIFAFGSQDLLKDVVSGFFNIFEDNFSVSDYVQLGEVEGTVIDVGLRTTKIKSWKGVIHIIQNSSIDHVVNYSIANGLAIVDVRVDYDTDIEDCLQVIETALSDILKNDTNIINPPIILGVNNLGELGIDIRIVAEVKPTTHWSVQRTMKFELYQSLKKANINIAYSQLIIKDKNKTS